MGQKESVFESKSDELKSNDPSILQLGDLNRNWLVGSPTKNMWMFQEYLDGQNASRLQFSWSSTFETNYSANEVLWKVWRKFAKNFCTTIFDSKDGIYRTSSAKNFAQNMKSACQFFCFKRYCPDIENVTPEDISAYETHIKNKKVSVSYAEALLLSVHSMFKDKPITQRGLSFDPYPLHRKLNKVAKKIGHKNGHTDTLSPEIGLSQIDSALNEVSNSNELLQRYEHYILLKEEHGKRGSRVYKQIYSKTVKDLQKDIDVLYGAAIVIVLSLSAMRKHEASQIRLVDVLGIAKGESETLTGRVLKTALTKTGRTTERGTVKEVQKAVQVIIRITRPMRLTNGHPLLLLRTTQYNCVNLKSVENPALSIVSLYLVLDKFSNRYALNGLKIRPHMFRRFFAMMWAWRFETGDLAYLSQMLWHNGYEFTTTYTEDEDVWKFMPEELRQLTHSIFEDMLLGEKKIAGGFSKTVAKYIQMLQSKVTLIGHDNAARLADELIERFGYVVIPAIDGYCFMSPNRASRAKCSTNSITPNYANRSEGFCSSCSNLGVPHDKSDVWEIRLEAHTKTAETATTEELRSASLEGIKLVKKMLRDLASK